MGKSSTPTQTTSTSYQTNIPEYAQPYVETMLGATQKQLFNTDSSGAITGFQPYQAYGGTYDANGNQISYDPSKAVAGFSPLQQQAQDSAANLQTPGQFGQGSAMAGMAGLGALNTANQAGMYGQYGAGLGQQGANIGSSLGQQSQDPSAMQNYMNPYIQNALNPALQLQQQQFGQIGAQNQGQATQSGAFGGGREAVMAGLNQQNQMLAQNQLVGNAYNQAFGQAQNQMNTANQAALAGNAQALQGAGIGLQGVGAQQAGYGQLGAAGSNLANIGGQELAAQQGILSTQNQVGAQQQANQQQIINQSMQDYANAQQYPLMQLGTMSNMLRGLPMQAQTTSQYVATPNPITQGIGALGAGASLYNATKAEGGVIKAAKGGIMSYDAGGAIRSTLEDMSDESLQQQLKSTSSDTVKNDIKEILTQRNMAGVTQAKNGGILHYKEGDVTSLDPSIIESVVGPKITPNVNNKPPVPVDTSAEDRKNWMYKNVWNPIGGGLSSIYDAINKNPKENGTVQVGQQNAINTPPAPAPAPDPSLNPVDKSTNEELTLPNGETSTLVGTEAERDKLREKYTNVQDKIQNGNKGEDKKINPNLQPLNTKKPVPIQTTAPADPNSILAASNFGAGAPPENPNAGKTTRQLMAEREAELGPNAGAQEQRARLMSEKANAKDESNRTFNLRMAEFFSLWGTTPGSTIGAGLNALKTKIPEFITDKKEERKVRMDIDKSMHSLDEADRAEKAGNYDMAQKIRSDAQKTAETTWAKKLEAGYHQYDADTRAASAKYVADKNLEGDIYKANASASKGGVGNDSKIIDRAEDNLRAVEGQIDIAKKSESYVNDEKLIKRLGSKKDLSDDQKKRLTDARTRFDQTNKDFQTRIDRAQLEYDKATGKKGNNTSDSETETKNKPKPINLDNI